jgi:flagellar basal body-associated protein FliL
MEENTNQTIETPKQNIQKSDKLTNTVIIVLLILIIVALGIVIGYQFLKKNGGSVPEAVTTTGQTTTTQESTSPQDNTVTSGPAIQNTGTAATTGITVKPDIDGDLKTLDKLDLSGVENDYGDSSLSDL